MNVYAYCPNCKGFVAGRANPSDEWKASQAAVGLLLEECEGRKIGRGCDCEDEVEIERLRTITINGQQRIAALESTVAESKAEVAMLEAKIVNIKNELNKALARLEAEEISHEDLQAAAYIYDLLG